MSENFTMLEPTETSITEQMAKTGADYRNAERTLRTQMLMDAAGEINDFDDVKAFLGYVAQKLGPLL